MDNSEINKWLKVGLLALVGATVAVVLVYAGTGTEQKAQNLKRKTQISKPQLKTQNLTPAPTLDPEERMNSPIKIAS